MAERGFCEEHKLVISRLDDVHSGFVSLHNEIKEMYSHIVSLESALKNSLETFQRYLEEQRTLEEKMANALGRIEGNLNRRIESIETRVDRVERQIDSLTGAIAFVKWLLGFAATSGVLSLLFMLLKMLGN